MTASIIDGKAIAKVIREEVKAAADKWREQGIIPRLDVVLVGDDPASVYYAKAKERLSQRVDVQMVLHQLPVDTSQEQLLQLVEQLNADQAVHGIMIELPLPQHIDRHLIMAAVHPHKDVDGVNPLNRGYLASGMDGLFPATPLACLEIIKRSGLTLYKQEAVLVGWGETVGKPLVAMMLKQGATVTTCHSKTRDLKFHTTRADVIVTAVGRPRILTADMVKPGAIVIDVGINETEEGIVGDVDFEAVKEVAGHITPVPGGVGSVTTVLLFHNLLKGMSLQQSQ
ncbi:MAG: bifunctional 5,10-methylenetetrahydrofolate dehydrogenase/5,10-methenyltetrahydrofolate cyclohydrolase [Bacillota bacterium]|jgi:methylenetetrahydrofolate dehydrogenase (NADP+)/methenyltetrahydrofolate cyclohydrolase